MVYILLAAAWISWMIPFAILKRNRERAAKVDRRARWGIVLQSVSYYFCWASPFWAHPAGPWRVSIGALLFLPGIWLSWTAVRTLGRQWRLDAGLNADHELVRAGPYRIIRHPIYASMLCMLLGTGMLLTPLPLLGVALLIYLIGTEIRVRVEDSLLESRFGAEFRTYRDEVAAYVPFVR